ncbi:hypothetical protein HAN_3g460 (nucleomorph) [Hemiselmis andersenii]|uniref:Uncharacterized protein n=1 Tax=Hemiselmis andersenii TaxID=464988 RepID=A9BL79_HEMAN|nr:hypothetical protein HAN_3g460 [Hemiselmis andersenii]ABW98262.1 hypothetical protein HAN_3g460 [Hemiselmis andersenii]|mmetsp:Transcript_50510/g.122507  ORF Transcript_50510/g.122507 Transcript_50510/m.122507 type:complete len:110 (+) Transcript_50510:1128-1457(+)
MIQKFGYLKGKRNDKKRKTNQKFFEIFWKKKDLVCFFEIVKQTCFSVVKTEKNFYLRLSKLYKIFEIVSYFELVKFPKKKNLIKKGKVKILGSKTKLKQKIDFFLINLK